MGTGPPPPPPPAPLPSIYAPEGIVWHYTSLYFADIDS